MENNLYYVAFKSKKTTFSFVFAKCIFLLVLNIDKLAYQLKIICVNIIKDLLNLYVLHCEIIITYFLQMKCVFLTLTHLFSSMPIGPQRN